MSSGERKRRRLNRVRVIPGRGCGCGVVGHDRWNAAAFRMMRALVSGTLLGRVTVEGESPVRENLRGVVGCAPE